MTSSPKGLESLLKAGDIPAMSFITSRDHERQIYLALQGEEYKHDTV